MKCIDSRETVTIDLEQTASEGKYWARGYKTFFILNSVKHEIFSANKY